MINKMQPRLSAVVAVARNGVIGRDGSLPWRMRDDLKWFKSVTMGKPVIMGRKTFEDIGKPLPGRLNIVLTRGTMSAAPGMVVTSNVDDAVKIGRSVAHAEKLEEACIIGGAEIYALSLAVCERLYITHIDATIDGDKRFDMPKKADWDIWEVMTITANDHNDYNGVVECWERRNK